MSQLARITSIFVDTPDYFAADLDNGNVRVGLRAKASFDLEPSHKMYATAKACTTSAQVEEIFDILVENS